MSGLIGWRPALTLMLIVTGGFSTVAPKLARLPSTTIISAYLDMVFVYSLVSIESTSFSDRMSLAGSAAREKAPLGREEQYTHSNETNLRV